MPAPSRCVWKNIDALQAALSECLVRTVAQRRVVRVLAGAQVGLAGGARRVGTRRELAALVRAIAEGLMGRLAARAPVIGRARFEIDTHRRTRRYDWISHQCHS